MKIGIDLDGVCYDFGESVKRFLGRPDLPDSVRWEFYEDWGITLAEFLQLMHDGVNAGVIFTVGDPMPGVHAALHRLRLAGHTLHVITDRQSGGPGRAAHATISWLRRHDLPFDTVTFSGDKTVVPTDFMIEDKLANYDALDKAGCNVFLINRPWNHIPGDQRRRVDTIGEFVDKVLNPFTVIGLAGYARTGKDTVANILVERHGFTRCSFAGKLKESLEILNPILDPDTGERVCDFLTPDGRVDWEYIKDTYPEGRRLPQVMGTDVGRKMFGDNVWIDLAMRSIEPGSKVVFSDCRFPNEADAVKAVGGQVWRLVRPGYGPANNHVSEVALDGYPHDRLLINDGSVEDLHWRVHGLFYQDEVSRVVDDTFTVDLRSAER